MAYRSELCVSVRPDGGQLTLPTSCEMSEWRKPAPIRWSASGTNLIVKFIRLNFDYRN
jgi:hypothetical protein